MTLKPIEGRFACTVRVGEKGQIVIPKEARQMFGIQPGDTLMLLADKKRGIAIPPKYEFEKLAKNLLQISFEDMDIVEADEA